MFLFFICCIIFLITNVDRPTFAINMKKSRPCFKNISRVEFCMVKKNRYIVFGFLENYNILCFVLNRSIECSGVKGAK